MSSSQSSASAREAGDRKRIICGIRPTGSVHIGNYYGAIKPAVALAQAFPQETLLFIADLHALSEIQHQPQAHKKLAEDTLSTAALYIAAVEAQGLNFSAPCNNGSDPLSSDLTLFVQSHIGQVSEMARLLGCITGMGMLNRMIQFKEKSRRGDDCDSASLTLFDYPVLMAADILLYQASHVPVGEDQRQHLELARELAQRFNRSFGTRLVLPQAHVGAAARIKSLSDGNRKMSKSDSDDNSRINLLDSAETIRRKIKKARTDSIKGLAFDTAESEQEPGIKRPEVDNLLNIYALATGSGTQAEREAIGRKVAQMGNAEFKELLSEALIKDLAPVQERYAKLMQNPEQVMAILRQGAAQASRMAAQTLAQCRAKVGLLAP